MGISGRLASRNILLLVSFELCDLHHQVKHQKIANESRNTHEQLGNICHVLCNAMIACNIMKYEEGRDNVNPGNRATLFS